jgi:hypothetical protein
MSGISIERTQKAARAAELGPEVLLDVAAMKAHLLILAVLLSLSSFGCSPAADTSESKEQPMTRSHTARSVRIRVLTAPEGDLSTFDPGEYLCSLEFYETDQALTEEDRDGLAQFVHFLAFLALEARSSAWQASAVGRDTSAYRALESHFGHLEGWAEVSRDAPALSYRSLVTLLMRHYPPHPPSETEQ